MLVPIHRWSVGLIHQPTRAEMVFVHHAQSTGTQTLDSQLWPLSPDVKTEAHYLSELYAGVLQFMERRA